MERRTDYNLYVTAKEECGKDRKKILIKIYEVVENGLLELGL
jgi:hypothetical protein